jgi:hypothetical protein
MASVGGLTKSGVQSLLTQLDEIEAGPGGGVITFDNGRLEVSNLRKLFWPKLKLTKGDLFRHYVRVAPFILPVLEDRALVMKRYPNGIAGAPFYQHRAPDKVPAGVRMERVNAGARDTATPHRRRARDAPLHGAAWRHLAGSLVLARGDAADDRPHRHRSRPA